MIRRVTYRRQNRYRTASNKIKIVKTPGSRLVVHYRKKIGAKITCADTGAELNGLPRVRPAQWGRLSKRNRTVARPYGGVLSAAAVRDRIVRAFLIEEVKLIKQMVAQKSAAKPSAEGKKKKKAGKK